MEAQGRFRINIVSPTVSSESKEKYARAFPGFPTVDGAPVQRRAIRSLRGGALEVETRDPIAPIDLPAWCRLTGHDYVGQLARNDPPCYAVRVAAQPAATEPTSPWRRVD